MTKEINREKGIKCSSFGASHKGELAIGDFDVIFHFQIF